MSGVNVHMRRFRDGWHTRLRYLETKLAKEVELPSKGSQYKERDLLRTELRQTNFYTLGSRGGRGRMEHRWGERRASNIAVHLGIRDGVLSRGWLRDVSLSGGYLVAVMPVALDQVVTLWPLNRRMAWSGDARLRGMVVRTTENGFALEWDPAAFDFSWAEWLRDLELRGIPEDYASNNSANLSGSTGLVR